MVFLLEAIPTRINIRSHQLFRLNGLFVAAALLGVIAGRLFRKALPGFRNNLMTLVRYLI
jgi:hypothetical protein